MYRDNRALTIVVLILVAAIAGSLVAGCSGGGNSGPVVVTPPPAPVTPPVQHGCVATATYGTYANDGTVMAQDAPNHFSGKPGVYDFAAVEAGLFNTMHTKGGPVYTTAVTSKINPSWTFERTTVGWILGPGTYHMTMQSANGVVNADLTVEQPTINGLTAKLVPFAANSQPYAPDDRGAYQISPFVRYDKKAVWYSGTVKVNPPAGAYVGYSNVVGGDLVMWDSVTDQYYGEESGDVYSIITARAGTDSTVPSVPMGVLHIHFDPVTQ